MKSKILIIAMGNSIHTVRWISVLSKLDYEVHLFNSFTIPNVSYFEKYPEGVILHNFESVTKKYMGLCFKHPIRLLKILKRFTTERFICEFATDMRSRDVNKLAELIRNNDFAIVHTLHTQTSGALFMEAMTLVDKDQPIWINTVWGSDLFLHQWLPDSKKLLQSILPKVDYYWGEGYRDYDLSRSMGFKGKFLVPVPAFGGFDVKQLEKLGFEPPSKRRRILIKGYMNVVGRAEIAFHALERCVDLLQGYELVIFSYENAIILTIGSIFASKYGIPVSSVTGISYEDILKLHLSARVSIMLSTSDGLPASFAEAMACGDFPIQSGSSMCNEWAEDGKNVIIVDPSDVNDVAKAIRRALTDDELVDKAAIENRNIIKERMDKDVINKQIAQEYSSVIGERDI